VPTRARIDRLGLVASWLVVCPCACARSDHPRAPVGVETGAGDQGGGSGGASLGGREGDGPVAVSRDAPAADPLDARPQESDTAQSPADTVERECRFALCEGFESYGEGVPPDPTLWEQKATRAVVDGMHAAHGKRALHVGPLIHDSILIRESKTFPALGKAFYARVRLWIEKEPLERPPNLFHWTLIEASESPTGGGRRVRLGGHIEARFPGDWLRFNYETSAATTPHETGLSDKGALVPPQRWHCIEVYFDMDRQEARVWLNGEERTALHWLDSMADRPLFKFPPEIKSLSFGWTEYQPPATPFEVWLDDIAVDAQRIGCNE
jgi:hypothetical protein